MEAQNGQTETNWHGDLLRV